MSKFVFDLQRFAEEPEQAVAPEDFGKMSAAEQSEILGKMVKGEPIAKKAEPVKEVEEEEPKAEEEPEEKQPVKRKLKVNGEEIELTDEEILAAAQKGISADKRFEEAAKLRKEAEAERKAIEAEKLQKQAEANKTRLQQTAQEVENFAAEFKKAFGEDFNQWDINHMQIFNQYQWAKMQQMTQQQQEQQIIQSAFAWADANPAEVEQLDDAIYALGSDPSARKQMRELLAARDRFDKGRPSIKDLQMLETFRTKAIATKPLPKEAVEEKKKVQKAEKSGGEQEKKADPGIDWDRFAKDIDYQTEVLGRRVRQK